MGSARVDEPADPILRGPAGVLADNRGPMTPADLFVANPESVRAACRGWQQTFPASEPGVTEQTNPFTGAGVGWGVRSPVSREADESPGLSSRFAHHSLSLESPAVEELLKSIARSKTDLTPAELSELDRPHLVGPSASTEVLVKVPERLVRFIGSTMEAELIAILSSHRDDVPFVLEIRPWCQQAVESGSAVFLVMDYS